MPRRKPKLWPSAERVREVEEQAREKEAEKEKRDQQHYQDYIDQLVAEAPELTDEQRARIAAILHRIK